MSLLLLSVRAVKRIGVVRYAFSSASVFGRLQYQAPLNVSYNVSRIATQQFTTSNIPENKVHVFRKQITEAKTSYSFVSVLVEYGKVNNFPLKFTSDITTLISNRMDELKPSNAECCVLVGSLGK